MIGQCGLPILLEKNCYEKNIVINIPIIYFFLQFLNKENLAMNEGPPSNVTQEQYTESLQNKVAELQKQLEKVQLQCDSLSLQNKQFKDKEDLIKLHLAAMTSIYNPTTPKRASSRSHVRTETDVIVMEDELSVAVPSKSSKA